MSEDVTERIRSGHLSAVQVLVIATCVLVNAVDGVDVLAIAFTAPVISDAWGVSPELLGGVFSAGLFGMMIGAFFLGPIGDFVGRRWGLMINLGLMTVGMFATAFTSTVIQLVIMRFITGLGIGGVLASANTMVAEFAPEKHKNFSLSLMHAGYPVGGVVGGLVAATIIGAYGWEGVFIAGALLSAVLMVVIGLFLPESVDYLLTKRPPDALERINHVLRRMGRETLSSLPAITTESGEGGVDTRKIRREVLKDKLGSTLLLWFSFFCIFLVVYFLLNWLPEIVVNAGFSLEQGISVGLLANLGAVAGVPLLGYISSMIGLRAITRLYLLGGAISLTVLAAYGTNINVFYVATLAAGFFLIGVISGCYSTSARMYSVEARNTGVGFAIGVGRAGAIAGPALAGLMIGAGWSMATTFLLFAIPLLLSIASVTALKFHDPKTLRFKVPFAAE